MRKLVLLAVCLLALNALRAESDSIDVLHYDLRLDIGNHTENRIEGSATVALRVVSAVGSLRLELCPSDIDSVWVDGSPTPYAYNAGLRLLSVPYAGVAGDTVRVTVFYRKGQQVMPQGWGGFYFDNNIYYNLGIAIYDYPHCVGKAWFPCRDNFTDKATYHFEITARPGWKAICTGVLDSTVYHSDSSSTWCWTLDHLTPTYLVGVAVAPFHLIERSFAGQYATYPALLGFLYHDSVSVWNAFDHMSKVIPAFEHRFGPYRWDRVGYVSTPKGSMEHVGNIAFTTQCMAASSDACLATMAHEFAHSWFGNLVTCASSEDMWINEGGASFCEEVAIEAIYADSDPLMGKAYARQNLKDVLLSTHVTDDGFKPVYGQTHDYTYGSTVYNKGATVWHSLRGYMGDSLFYATMQQLFERCAFQNMDSWQLRDTLSMLSGMDLSDFFDFHVFSAGFNDYRIDSLVSTATGTTVYVRQQNYGTDALMDGNRVWVTFFSPQLERAQRLIAFDGAAATVAVELPFEPLFAEVDMEEALSKASIGQALTIRSTGTHEAEDALFYTNVRKLTGDSIWLYVKHHWCAPDTSLSPRYLRMADRYWTVDGVVPEGSQLGGCFYFCRMGEARTLDEELITNITDFEQVSLLYRRDASEDWRPITKKTLGNSTQGYYSLQNLLLGEYTLGMVDTSYVGIEEPAEEQNEEAVQVYPNPTTGSVTLTTRMAGEPLIVDVCDASGRPIMKEVQMKSGEAHQFQLPTGVYHLLVRQPRSNRMTTVRLQFMNF